MCEAGSLSLEPFKHCRSLSQELFVHRDSLQKSVNIPERTQIVPWASSYSEQALKTLQEDYQEGIEKWLA